MNKEVERLKPLEEQMRLQKEAEKQAAEVIEMQEMGKVTFKAVGEEEAHTLEEVQVKKVAKSKSFLRAKILFRESKVGGSTSCCFK